MRLDHFPCPACRVSPSHTTDSDAMTVTACDCGAYRLVRFVDPAARIRQALDQAEARYPNSSFLASLRQQFADRGTLSPVQQDRLFSMAAK